jgi:uncharacterized membrane protein YfcA
MDILSTPLLWIILIVFLGALVRSTFGFGDALIEMPLLALVISIKVATPIVAAYGIVLAIAILLREWKHINLRSTWRLILSSAIGIPFGIYYLHAVPESITKIGLGIILILTALFNIVYPKNMPTVHQNSAYGFGFLAGVLGSAYNTNGPPILLYAVMQKWDPATFRATMQSYFLPVNLLIVISHIGSGLWQTKTLSIFLYGFPVVIGAFFLGTFLSGKLDTTKFNKALYAVVLGMGIILIVSIL